MWRLALERGLSGLVAKRLREARLDALFAQIAKTGAIAPEQVTKLRSELEANLRQAEAEGGPYVDVLSVALRELTSRVPHLREAVQGVGRAAADAAAKTAEAAKAEVQRAAAEVERRRRAPGVAANSSETDVIDTVAVAAPVDRP